jgi:hypothetical protein
MLGIAVRVYSNPFCANSDAAAAQPCVDDVYSMLWLAFADQSGDGVFGEGFRGIAKQQLADLGACYSAFPESNRPASFWLSCRC